MEGYNVGLYTVKLNTRYYNQPKVTTTKASGKSGDVSKYGAEKEIMCKVLKVGDNVERERVVSELHIGTY